MMNAPSKVPMMMRPFRRRPSSPPAWGEKQVSAAPADGFSAATADAQCRTGKRPVAPGLLVITGMGTAIALALAVTLGLSTGLAPSTPAAAQEAAADTAAQRAQLTAQLRMLQRSKQGLGANHPSVAGIQAQIAEIQQQLRALPRASTDPDPTPSPAAESAKPAAAAASTKTRDPDLREVVLTMAEEIGRLNRRVNLLEDEVAELKSQVAGR